MFFFSPGSRLPGKCFSLFSTAIALLLSSNGGGPLSPESWENQMSYVMASHMAAASLPFYCYSKILSGGELDLSRLMRCLLLSGKGKAFKGISSTSPEKFVKE